MGKRKGKRRTAEFVLDCSVTLAWFFEDETDPYADAVRDALAREAAVVPALWRLEVANAPLMGERRKRTTEAKVQRFLTLLQALPITMDDEAMVRAWSDVLGLARTHELTTYDAAYLEVAQRRGLSLASLDEELKAAAAKAGVPEYIP